MTDPRTIVESPRPRGLRLFVAIVLAVGVGTVLIAALLTDIFQKKQEARRSHFRVVELTDQTEDPAEWGKNYPLHYDDYRKTVDMVQTRFGGSEAIPRDVTEDDPRTVTAQSKLDHLPALRRMWAGYAFAKDFREERGHAFMLEDQLYSERQTTVAQPGTCIQCHASVYVPMMKLGEGDLMAGFDRLNQTPYSEAKEQVSHPVTCIDCHDPESMALRITRPAFMEGIAAARAAEGVADYDVNAQATRQEMRTYVCAQCHVEYYFKGDEKRLTYPWHKGLKVEQILAYYDEAGFRDWQHAETGAPMLKAQHPEFEMWSQGIHARAGVTCSDCHMPYKRVGAAKISDHHVRSPLLTINNACQTCHKVPESELRSRVESTQERTVRMRDIALDALVEFIDELKAARDAGASDESLAEARQFHRRASFYIDFVEAENSAGFHADQEAVRILGEAINFVRLGQAALRKVRDN